MGALRIFYFIFIMELFLFLAHRENNIVLCDAALHVNKEKASSSPTIRYVVHWNKTIQISKTLATLQVVDNPLLNMKTSPVAAQAWKTLGNLNASRVRYAAWFPYPQWSVPELTPPNATTRTTSWDFTGFMSQLSHFINNVHSAVLELSTMPLWLFKAPWVIANASTHPNQVDWDYSQGKYMPNSTQQGAAYFGRIASYLYTGSFTDEFGKIHSGGPKFSLEKAPWWEVLNEPEGEFRGKGPTTYTAFFDDVVTEIRRGIKNVEHQQSTLKFQGLALAGHGEWNWYETFLTRRHHIAETRDAVNAISFHFYATPSQRVINSTWSYEMFQALDAFEWELKTIISLRDRLSPNTQLSCDEMGSILPDDNSANAPIPSRLYYVAASGLFAAAFGVLSELGVDVAGCSQLAGCPPLPTYGIHEAQYPSVALLNWTNGQGNARYWTLYLLIDHFSIGDKIVETTTRKEEEDRKTMCGSIWNYNSLWINPPHVMTLTCPAGSTIASVSSSNTKIAYLLGNCNHGFQEEISSPNVTCSDEGTLHQFAEQHCIGRRSCALTFDNATIYVVNGTKKPNSTATCPYSLRMIVSATCSNSEVGMATPSGYLDDQIYVQARLVQSPSSQMKKKLLVVNKNNDDVVFRYQSSSSEGNGLKGSTIYRMDVNTQGPADVLPNYGSDSLPLKPFAVAVVELP